MMCSCMDVTVTMCVTLVSGVINMCASCNDASLKCVLYAGVLQTQLGDECLTTECHSGHVQRFLLRLYIIIIKGH